MNNLLEIRGLRITTLRGKNTVRLLDRVDLEIAAGESVALTGASGIGKTTLARILLGLERDFEGELSGLPEKRACVFQEDRLLPQLTVGDNVRH